MPMDTNILTHTHTLNSCYYKDTFKINVKQLYYTENIIKYFPKSVNRFCHRNKHNTYYIDILCYHSIEEKNKSQCHGANITIVFCVTKLYLHYHI